MRRLGRYIFNGLTVLSLLICFATVVLWVRGRFIGDMLIYDSPYTFQVLMASHEGIEYLHYLKVQDTSGMVVMTPFRTYLPGLNYERGYYSEGAGEWWLEGRGLFYHRNKDEGKIDMGLPYWFICLITALAPAARLTARLRRKRPSPGLCPKCRYDLRATPDRCPECGTVVAEPAKKWD